MVQISLFWKNSKNVVLATSRSGCTKYGKKSWTKVFTETDSSF